MARPAKKTVYEKIEDVKKEILKTEELLVKLNEELQTLNSEKDDLEMHQIFEMVRSNGLSIDKVTELLQGKSNNKKDK